MYDKDIYHVTYLNGMIGTAFFRLAFLDGAKMS